MPLEPPDLRLLTAAEGYAELGMYPEANAALDRIDPDVQHVPEVLAVRHDIYRGVGDWSRMKSVSAKLAEFDPDNAQWAISLAYAIRRAESIEAAKAVLVQAQARHPEEAMIPFNLACYDSQMGSLDSAKAYLSKAFELHPGLRKMALEDRDLEPLWNSI